jgi:hypothetical protein
MSASISAACQPPAVLNQEVLCRKYPHATQWRLRLIASATFYFYGWAHFPTCSAGARGQTWVRFHRNTITVVAGYASDGASPKFRVGPWVLGTPDTAATLPATFLHDALYQFAKLPGFPFTLAEADDAFDQCLAFNGCETWRRLAYVGAVRAFGHQFHGCNPEAEWRLKP